jgi:phosphatidylglycerophosphate synthase
MAKSFEQSTRPEATRVPPFAKGGRKGGPWESRTALLTFKNAVRVQESLLSGPERKLLLWVAARTPAWVNSDHLTLLGFFGQVMAGASYGLARWHRWGLVLSTAFLALNWFGDSLDGTLARFRNQQRPRYGFYVDHIIDTFAAFALMAGLAVSGYIHPYVAIGLLVAFLMLSIEVYLATYTMGKFQLSYWIFGPTELRIVLGIGNVALLYHPMAHIAGRQYRLFDVGGVIAIAGMTIMLIVSAIVHTVQLYREERI